MSGKISKGPESVGQDIEQQETLTKKLESLKVADLSDENFDSFIKQLENIKNNSEYDFNDIENKLLNKRFQQKNILPYFKDKGYPINTQDNKNFDLFLKVKLKIEKKEEDKKISEEINKNSEEILLTKQKIEILFNENLLPYLDKNKDSLKFSDIGSMFLTVLENGTFEEAVEFFENNSEELLVELAHTNPKLFKATKKFAVESLGITELKNIEYYQGIEWSKSESDPWNETKIFSASKSISEIDSVDNKAVAELDLNHVPPKYSLSALDSDYKMETKLDSKDISDATDNYLEAEGISNDGMKNLDGFSDQFGNMVDKIKSIRVESSGIEGQEESKMKLKSIVNSFKITLLGYLTNIYDSISDIPEGVKITEQDISNIGNNPADFMVNISNVSNKINSLKDFISNIPVGAYKKYEEKLKAVVENDVKNKDVQINTLNFLKSIGFDGIDKTVTDGIFSILDSKDSFREQFGFTGKIDLMKGNLGTNKDGNLNKISFKEKKVFIEFVNLMISGEKDIPNHITSGGEIQFFENKQDMDSGNVSGVNRKSFINGKLGMNPDSVIKKNLGLIN